MPHYRLYPRSAFACLLLLVTTPLLAHPTTQNRLQALEHEIASHPEEPTLYLRRAEAFGEEHEWARALAEFDRAEALGAEPLALALGRGASLLRAGHADLALPHIDHALTMDEAHTLGLHLRARALGVLGDPEGAARALERAAATLARPSAEMVLEWSEHLQRAGRPAEALARIDQALDLLGPLSALRLEALDLARALGPLEAVLGRLDAYAGDSAVPERFLVQRGEVLEKLGRHAAARRAYDATLAATAARPPRSRAGLLTSLRQRAEKGLARLAAPHTSAARSDNTDSLTQPQER